MDFGNLNAIYDSKASKDQKAFLAFLCFAIGANAECWYSIPKIAEKMGAGEAWVRSTLRGLIESGIVLATEEVGRPLRCRIDYEALKSYVAPKTAKVGLIAGPHKKRTGSVHGSRSVDGTGSDNGRGTGSVNGTGGGSVDGRGVVPCTEDELHSNVTSERNNLTPQEPPAVEEGDLFGKRPEPEAKPKKPTPPSKLTEQELDAQFEVFWKAIHMNKVDKGRGRKNYRTAVRKKHVTLEYLIQARLQQESRMTSIGKAEFVNKPANWLSGEGWLDELPSESPSPFIPSTPEHEARDRAESFLSLLLDSYGVDARTEVDKVEKFILWVGFDASEKIWALEVTTPFSEMNGAKSVEALLDLMRQAMKRHPKTGAKTA